MDFAPLVLSFEVAIVAAIIASLIGISMGALLANYRFPGRDLLDVLLTAPIVLPPTVLGYYLLVTLGRRSFIGIAYEQIFGSTIVFTRTGAVCAAVVGSLPLVVTTARAALEGVHPTLMLAARSLGATDFRAFTTVQLPLAARGLIAALMLAFARSLGEFGITLMVAGDIPGETQTASLAIYDAIQAHRDNEALGMVLILTAVAVGALYLVNKLSRKGDERDAR